MAFTLCSTLPQNPLHAPADSPDRNPRGPGARGKRGLAVAGDSEAEIKRGRPPAHEGMQEPVLPRVLSGRVWSYGVASMAMLGLTAVFGVLVDSGLGLAASLAGAGLAAGLLVLAGRAVQQRSRRQGSL